MGIAINSIANRDKLPATRFDLAGDSVSGTITAADLVADTINPGSADVLVLTIDDREKVWARSAQMREAIADAVDAAGAESIDVGDDITITYVEDKVLRNGRVMKVYRVVYAPSGPIGAGTLADFSADTFGGES
jgi:hypothetical protein